MCLYTRARAHTHTHTWRRACSAGTGIRGIPTGRKGARWTLGALCSPPPPRVVRATGAGPRCRYAGVRAPCAAPLGLRVWGAGGALRGARGGRKIVCSAVCAPGRPWRSGEAPGGAVEARASCRCLPRGAVTAGGGGGGARAPSRGAGEAAGLATSGLVLRGNAGGAGGGAHAGCKVTSATRRAAPPICSAGGACAAGRAANSPCRGAHAARGTGGAGAAARPALRRAGGAPCAIPCSRGAVEPRRAR